VVGLGGCYRGMRKEMRVWRISAVGGSREGKRTWWSELVSAFR
jgi:hypothetical protein